MFNEEDFFQKEKPRSKKENINENDFEKENFEKIYINEKYIDLVPFNFLENPEKYIESNGENIKSGEKKYHEDGSVKEDPTASKILPQWENQKGETISVVSKKVNLEKVRTKTTERGEKFQDPLLEYKMISLAKLLDLPTAEPIGFLKQNNKVYNLMEKLKGYTWTKRDKEKLFEMGFSEKDEKPIKNQIIVLMQDLKDQYEEFGIYRKWKYKDMVFDIDFENKNVTDIVPVDWEKSYIDRDKLMKKISDFPQEKIEEIKKIILLKI